MYSDSSAALGIAQRQGMGRVRHIRTQALWVQETRAEGRLSYKKVLGTRNPADLLTKHMGGPLISQHLTTLGAITREGRAEAAPNFDLVIPYTEKWHLKRVRFDPVIKIRNIEVVGKGRPVRESVKMKFHGKGCDAEEDSAKTPRRS